MGDQITRERLADLDAADPLRGFRDEFLLPEGVVYLDGNSLGALPARTADRVAGTLRKEWGKDLIRSWNVHDWIGLPQKLGDKIGKLIGAEPGQVVVTDSTSVDLFKLLAAALQVRPDRNVILTERGNFPTDVYMAQGLVRLLGGHPVLRRVEGNGLAEAIDGETAVVLVTHVNYQTGAMHDLGYLTEAAHRAGALILWDLSHTVGVVPVELDGVAVDLAVGCGYKYLNGGPGAPAFVYVARALQEQIQPVLSGWMGHAAPFAFQDDYEPAPGVGRLLVGTPPILSMVALESAVDLYLEADLVAVREKSMSLTQTFIDLVREHGGDELVLAGPEEAARRGSQVSFRHPEGYAIIQALIDRRIIGDFRTPDLLRFGFAPLYVRFVDLWEAVMVLAEVLKTRAWDHPRYQARPFVT